MTSPTRAPKTASQEGKLAERVYKLQLALVRDINDTHIFVQQALPLLRKAQKQYATSNDGDDRRYIVPSHKRSKFANRTDEELREIYGRYIATELYNNLLATIVSKCESFIFDVLRLVLRAYPKKLTMNIRGLELKRTVDMDTILSATDIEQLHCALIEQRLHSITYAKPAEYLQYLRSIAHINTDDKAFGDYVELKATRDNIVHNGGIANATYRLKAGTKARAKEGQRLVMNAAYFDQCVATIKRVSGIIKRDIEAHFPTS